MLSFISKIRRFSSESVLVRNSAIYGFGAILNKLLGFFLVPVYTRYFTVEEYGQLALLNVLLQLLSFVMLLGLGTASIRFYLGSTKDGFDKANIYGVSILIIFVMSPVLTAVFYLIFREFSAFILPNIPFAPFIVLTLVIGFFRPAIDLLSGLLRAQGRAMTYVLFFLSFFFVQCGAILLSIVYFKLGLYGQLLSQLIATVIFAGVALTILWRYAAFQFSLPLARSLLGFGLPLVPYFIFIWIGNAAGRFALDRFAGLAEVGLFTLAFQFAGLILLMATAVDKALMPEFIKLSEQESSAKRLGELAIANATVFALVGLGVVALADPIIFIAVGSDYHGAAKFIPLLTFAFWTGTVGQYYTWSLTHTKRTKTLSAIHLVSTVILILSLYILLNDLRMGVVGVIFSMIVANVILIIAKLTLAKRFQDFRLPVFRYVFALIFFTCSFLLMDYLSGDAFAIERIGSKIGLFLVCGLIAWKMRLITILPRGLGGESGLTKSIDHG